MSYNNPSGEATYTYTNSGTLILDPSTSGLIASSAGDTSQYYAQNLTIPTGGAIVSGATIDDKGKLYTNQTVYNITVLSGGTLQRGGGGIGANNITVMSGGTMLGWNGGQAYWAGTWNIQSGANIFGYTDVYTDADGYLNYGWHGLTGALNPYIKIRNIDVNSYLYVRGGGVSGAIVRGGATAANNAFLHFSAANLSAYDVHVLSGGSFAISAGNAKIWNIKGDQGARMTFQANNSFGGRETEFAKGFWTNVGLTETYADQGTIYNWAKPSTGAAFYFYDITLDTGDATNQYVYLGDGAETRNFTIGGASGAKTGIVLGQAGQGAAIDTTATGEGGGITVNSSYYAIFGGTNNNVTAGHILLGGAGAGVANASLSIIDDKFYGIEVKNYSNNSTYLKNVKLVEGLTAVDPIVSSGGSLVLGSGGSATGAVIHAGGTIQALKGGTVSGATLSSGYLYIMDYNLASETASVGRPAAFANNVDIEGGQVFLRGSNASGANLRLSNGIIYMQNAAHASAVTVTGGALSAYYNNVNPKDASTIYINDLTVAGGAADLYNYAQVDGATITGGAVTMQGTARLSGATVTGGSVTMTGGVVSGATLSNTGKLFVSTGASALNVTINNPATSPLLTVYAGGYASGVTLVGPTGGVPGTNYIYMYGGLIEDIIVDSGSIYLANGGLMRNITVRNAATPVLRGETPYCSGATIEGGTLQFQNGAKGQDVVVNGGGLIVINNGYGWNTSTGIHGSGAQVTGIDVVAGTVTASAGAKLYDLRVSAGTVTVASTTSFGTPFVSGATITGGTVNIITGASMNVATVNAGVVSASNATVRNATVNGGVLYALYDAKVYDTILTGGSFYVYNHGLASGAIIDGNGTLRVHKGGTLSGATLNAGYLYIMDNNNASETSSTGRPANVAIDVVQNGGQLFFRGSNASGANVQINDGLAYIQNAGYVSGLTMRAGTLTMAVNGGVNPNDQPNTIRLLDAVVEGGTLNVNNHAVVSKLNATGGTVVVANGGTIHAVEGDMLTNLSVATGATIDYANGEHTSGAMIRGDKTNIAANTLVYSGAVLDAQVADGVMTNLGNNGNYYRMRVGTGITVVGAVVGNGHRLYVHEDAEVVGATINAGGNIGILGSAVGSKVRTYAAYNIFESGSAKDTTVEKGGVLRFNAATAKATGTVVSSGGTIRFQNGIGGGIDDTTLKAGAALELYAGAETGDNLYLDFEGSTAAININNLALVNAETAIHMINIAAGNTYTFATAGDTTRTVNCEWSDYSNALKAGESYTNAFTGIGYSFNAAGTAIATTAFDIGAAKATAGSVTTDDAALNTNDRAAKWDANTTYTDSVTVAGSGLAGDAWLEIDGTDVSTALYGAEGAFGHTVNIYAKSGKIRNLAAGAKAGGSVAGVMLTVEGENTEFTGVAYAGGFGSVTGKADTYVADGTFTKDFYAGALANKNAAQTTVGEVALSITGGTFKGNVYGASAVKTDTTVGNDLRNATGNVTVSVSGGSTDKQDFCLFAGGYATGNATGTVYTVNDIDVDITGGTWVGDTVHGGRGVFGGVFASGVTAEAQDVTITISGDAKLGNVYGGGWAQKGGTSIVDDVEINIEGGTVANVFGGGTHSIAAPGGSTVVDDVKITVSGGDITGAIYVGGQGVNDSVTGNEISVTFTGDTDFGCGVYGYSYAGGTVGDATLSFTGYSGDFSGAIGGFVGITFAKDTEMELATAADDVSNGAWTFDVAERDAEMADTALLKWTAADFTGDTITLNLGTGEATAWTLIDAASTTAYGTFDVDGVASELVLDQKIADTGTAYDGWGFTLDSGVLKFKQLA